MVGALGKHIALVGFMGAGKSTIGREVARLSERPFIDLDAEIERRHGPIPELFADGESGFRRLEEETAAEILSRDEPAVIALGGGAVASQATRKRLDKAFVAWISVEVETAWERVRDSDRPLAQDEASFRRLYEQRAGLYDEVAHAAAADAEGVLLAALHVQVRRGLIARLPHLVAGSAAIVGDERVLELHPLAVGGRVHGVPPGEAAKRPEVVDRLWRELELSRDGTLVAYGGGSITDTAGFVAATYLRGIPWIAVPTTLVGQVDAAIGGKTGVDLPQGKNLVGAFHLPERVLVDPAFLATLTEQERRNGMAEVVKTGLLADRPLWELPEEEMIRSCAAFKCAVVLSDPYERGRRAILNLGHTFGHALEAASHYAVAHGEAVALGLVAALRLSGQPTDVVENALSPDRVRVDRERAWAALQRDKKVSGGRVRLVLLPEPGKPQHGVELPERDVRAALDELIRD